MKCASLLAATVLFSMSALAQTATELTGKWQGQWQTPRGVPRTGSLELQNGAGTWQTIGVSSQADACAARPSPARIEVRDGQPTLVLLRSQVIASCPDVAFKLEMDPDGTLKTAWDDGRPMLLKKQ